MILSADTNLFLYAANPDSPHHNAARRFFDEQATGTERFPFAATDKLHRLAGKLVGNVVELIVDREAIAIQRIAADCLRKERPRTRVEHKRVIEPSLVRPLPLVEADVPLADHARRVSGFF
ncbi:MAG: hypothetical protein R3C05_07705 [Pirellulaceae bacterium]